VGITKLSWRLIVLACGVFMLATACHRSTADPPAIVLEHEVTPTPARIGSETITLQLKDPSGNAVTRAHISLEGNMSHPGMGPSISDAQEREPGKYQATLEFSMAGDWVVLVHITLSDGQRLERQFDLKGVR